ncbi:DoxX family protein [Bradyrhizobium prioriisuperbiae]|uniref:DoxX family protein n=1 Tax=Bradyrhizobium prioriisuperbiae TaxID=2854389 RepID=UPI0028EAA16D|nr:DoxX family protein [Bradyrhizobium prioritasuperba]
MSTPDILSILLAVVMARAGWLNLTAPDFIRAEFRAWGYSERLRIGVGVLEWIAAAALLIPSLRPIGCAIAVIVLLGVIATLWRHREFMRVEYPALLLAVTLLTAAHAWGWFA